MKLKIIIFDMDGVLFDTKSVLEKFLLHLYPSLTLKSLKELLSGNFHEEIKKILHLKREETTEEATSRKLRYAEEKSQAPLYKGAQELLTELRTAGFILTLNTSAMNVNCLPLLERAHVTHFFAWLGTGDVSYSKVAKFQLIAEKYKVEAKDMLFVTDTLGDIREADSAGVPTVAVTWGAHDESYFSREQHDNLVTIVHTFAELRDFIKRWANL